VLSPVVVYLMGAGAVAVVPAFNLLVPDASVIGSEQFPAPSVQVWAGVSRALTDGMSGLHPTARTAAAPPRRRPRHCTSMITDARPRSRAKARDSSSP
jgi:hypothetical protein